MNACQLSALGCRLRRTFAMLLLAAAACPSARAQQLPSTDGAPVTPSTQATRESASGDNGNVADNPRTTAPGTLPESGQPRDRPRQEDLASNQNACLEALRSVNDKLHTVKADVDDLAIKLRTVTEAITQRLEHCNQQVEQLDDELNSLRKKNAELEDRAAQPSSEPRLWSLDDHRLWVVGLLAFLSGTLLNTVMRKQSHGGTAGGKRDPAVQVLPAPTKRIDLALRNPAGDWQDLSALVDHDWRDLPVGTAWKTAWATTARDAMQQVMHSSQQPAGRNAAADFAGNVWARFVSQFEPDRNSWAWTDEQCRQALPDELRLELGPVRPNEPYNQHASVITQASGEGQFVADVLFPGCRVQAGDGRTLHESGAVVVKGDRL